MPVNLIKMLFNAIGITISRKNTPANRNMTKLKEIFSRYQLYTMISEEVYVDNLMLCQQVSKIEGDIIECGVWKGGMIAGIAQLLGNNRKYYLFDSFEGLPAAREIDGSAAIAWQGNKKSAIYYDNCTAEEEFAISAMKLTGTTFFIKKGWFDKTLPSFSISGKIAILRLDGDWYDSTLTCLKYLYPQVNYDGLIILDDYYTWEGCCKAVHDYLSSISSASRIHRSLEGVAYIIKKDRYGN